MIEEKVTIEGESMMEEKVTIEGIRDGASPAR